MFKAFGNFKIKRLIKMLETVVLSSLSQIIFQCRRIKVLLQGSIVFIEEDVSTVSGSGWSRVK
jgi:hypothetical protein